MTMVKIEGIEIPLETLEKAIANAKKEDEYPKCRKNVTTNEIVLFSGLYTAISLTGRRKGKTMQFVQHDNFDRWEQIPYDQERGFFDGQVVWCWDNDMANTAGVSKYSVEKRNVIDDNDDTDRGTELDNYSAEMPKHIADLM